MYQLKIEHILNLVVALPPHSINGYVLMTVFWRVVVAVPIWHDYLLA